METNKIIGYVLLIIGLAAILLTAYQSYNIFIGKTSAPLIFKTSLPQQTANNINPLNIQAQINETVRQQITQIISPDAITKALNLLSWSFLAGLFIMAGGAIAGIGVKLVK